MDNLLLGVAILLLVYTAFFVINLVNHIVTSINKNYFELFYIIGFIQALLTVIAGFIILHVSLNGSLNASSDAKSFVIDIENNTIKRIYVYE